MKKLILLLLFLFLFTNLSFGQSSLDSLRLVVPIGHSDEIIDLKLSMDGSKLLTRSYDNSCGIYDIRLKKELFSVGGSGTYIFDANFSTNSDIIFICSDSTVSIFNVAQNKTISILNGHRNLVQSGMFNSTDEQILTASWDGTAQIHDIKSSQSIKSFKGHRGKLNSAIYSSSDDLIVTTGEDSLIIVWDVKTAKSITELKTHGEITYAEFSPNDKYVVASSRDSNCYFMDLSNNKIFKLPGYPNHGGGSFGLKKSFDFSQNSEFLVTYIKNTLYLWKIVSGIPKLSWKLCGKGEVNSAKFDFSGNFILTGNSDNSAFIYSTKTGSEVKEIKGHKSDVNCALFAPQLSENDTIPRIVITCSDDKTVRINDVLSGRSIVLTDNLYMRAKMLSKINDSILAVVFQNSRNLRFYNLKDISSYKNIQAHNKPIKSLNTKVNAHLFLTIGNDSKIKVWKKKEFEEWRTIEVNNYEILFAEISPDSSKVLTYSTDSLIRIWNNFTGQLNKVFKPPCDLMLRSYDINWKKNILVFSCGSDEDIKRKEDTFFLYNISSGDKLRTVKTHFDIGQLIFSVSGEYIAITTIDSTLYLYDTRGKKKFEFVGHKDEIDDLNFFNNDRYLYSTSYDGSVIIWDVKTGLLVFHLKGHSEFIVKSVLSEDERFLATASFDNTTKIWDVNEGKLNHVFNGPNGWFKSLVFIGNSKLLITGSEKESLKLLDIVSGKIISEILFLKYNNWFVKLGNSPYYMCSKDASKILHYVTPSLKVIGFEQLDPVYNRPDIVLDSIGKYFGGADQELVSNYRQSWEKRIDRLGLDKEKLGKGEISVPNAEIVGADGIPYENKYGKLEINVSANDPKYPLRRFNVYINEVPVYGSAGISIAHMKKQMFDTTVSVPLSVGENKIQVSVMNELGLENFKYPTYVNYTPAQELTAKTYYIGIGVNEFKESSHNLKYCVKDVTDLAKSFGGPNTEVKLFSNQQVTKENILALKAYLNKTTVNDKVIISCSSHGLLDDSLNFYLAMHDVDFDNPQARGLKYEELESLLDGIPARQKLLLLDACNSGENDKTEVLNKEIAQLENQKQTNEITTEIGNIKGVKAKLEEENKSNFKKMNELFVNVRNNTGSVIISAAGGQESALEAINVDGKTIENGAFTYSILECLKQNEGKELKVNTLKQYAEKRVEEITNGKQKPTSRQETMEVDWGVR